MVGFSNENGNIKYSDEVLGKIVGLSTMECYGVVGMVSKNASEGFWELIRVENLSKGVKITLTEDDKLNIELFAITDILVPYSTITNNSIFNLSSSVSVIFTPLLKFSTLISSQKPSLAFLETIPTTP